MKRYKIHKVKWNDKLKCTMKLSKDGEWVKCKEAYESIDWLLEFINALYEMNTIKEIRKNIDEGIISRKKE